MRTIHEYILGTACWLLVTFLGAAAAIAIVACFMFGGLVLLLALLPIATTYVLAVLVWHGLYKLWTSFRNWSETR